MKLIGYAKKQEDREYLFRHYLMIYPNMDKKTYKPFEQYYQEVVPNKAQLDDRHMDDIMNEILNVKV